MKTFLLLIASATLALAAGQTQSITDNLEVMIVDSKGNVTNGGRLIDHVKMRPAEVQAVLDAKLAAKATADPLATRKLIDVAKASGATVVKATEDKVKAAEDAKAVLDAAVKAESIAIAPTP